MQAPLVAQQEKRRSGLTATYSRRKAVIDGKKYSNSPGLPLFLQAKRAVHSSPNQAGLLLQRKCACGSPASSSDEECATCASQKRLALQTKLKIGAPGDIYEQEADRIADQVLTAPAYADVSSAAPRIQRYAGSTAGQGDMAPPSVEQVVSSSGRPLEPALRQDMERRFGHDFSRVRVHSGGAAEHSARDVNASAYTVGHDIVFGAGQLAPRTLEGRRLIAHELAHVVQQSGAEGVRFGQSNVKRGLSPICPPICPLQRQVDDTDQLPDDRPTELGPSEETCGVNTSTFIWESKGNDCGTAEAMITGNAQSCGTKCSKEARLKEFNAKAEATCRQFCSTKGDNCTANFVSSGDCADYDCRSRAKSKNGVCPDDCPMYEHCLQLPKEGEGKVFNCKCDKFKPS